MTATGHPVGSVAFAIAWFAALLLIAAILGTVDTGWRKLAWLTPPNAADIRPAEVRR